MEIKRRHRIEIFHKMLSIIEKGVGLKKTKIFWESCINNTMGNIYISMLSNKELVEETNRCYFITEKGKRWIERFEELLV